MVAVAAACRKALVNDGWAICLLSCTMVAVAAACRKALVKCRLMLLNEVNMRQESKGQGRSDVDGNWVGCGLHMRTSSFAWAHLVAFSLAVSSAND